MDDCGTGCSSYLHPQALPLDEVKVGKVIGVSDRRLTMSGLNREEILWIWRVERFPF